MPNTKKDTPAPIGSFTREIMKTLMALDRSIANPDAKHNQGKMIGEAYLWNVVRKYAEIKYAEYMSQEEKKRIGVLISSGLVTPKDRLTPGDHDIAESPSFVITAKVTQPIERFDALLLATTMSKVFKKPVSSCAAMIEDAKKPTKSTVTYTIAERV